MRNDLTACEGPRQANATSIDAARSRRRRTVRGLLALPLALMLIAPGTALAAEPTSGYSQTTPAPTTTTAPTPKQETAPTKTSSTAQRNAGVRYRTSQNQRTGQIEHRTDRDNSGQNAALHRSEPDLDRDRRRAAGGDGRLDPADPAPPAGRGALAHDYEIADRKQRVDLARCSDRQLDAAV